ncbi:MAG: hypothetical protein ACOCRX_11320 [Candidatus Woesearchaeota archaeon]
MRKRIYNPVTRRYYNVRRTSSRGAKKGEIKSLWSSKYSKKDS